MVELRKSSSRARPLTLVHMPCLIGFNIWGTDSYIVYTCVLNIIYFCTYYIDNRYHVLHLCLNLFYLFVKTIYTYLLYTNIDYYIVKLLFVVNYSILLCTVFVHCTMSRILFQFFQFWPRSLVLAYFLYTVLSFILFFFPVCIFFPRVPPVHGISKSPFVLILLQYLHYCTVVETS